ncbi:MAG: endonuclease/exonuclease/phosphatase family protein [Akkermansiaceae bacterium]|nr:endonuclease/exonuclease/phosphatase family protein [Akkermansiaceae bacterium]
MNTSNRIHVVLAVFIAASFLLAIRSMAEAPKPVELGLKVASFNIRYLTTRDKGDKHWNIRKTRTIAALRHFDADVIGLQEASPSQVGDMQPSITDYGRVGVGRDDGAEKGETCSVLYRKDRIDLIDQGTFWLSDSPEVAGSKHWGNEVVRICTWVLLYDKPSKRRFYVFNCHFDHVSQVSREHSVRLIARRIANRDHPDAPFILTGDFNADEANPAIRYLKGESVILAGGEGVESTPVKMRDSFRILNPDIKEVCTSHGFTGKTEGSKIDFVFVPEGAVVKESAIDYFKHDGLYPSDHYPVTTTLVFPSR